VWFRNHRHTNGPPRDIYRMIVWIRTDYSNKKQVALTAHLFSSLSCLAVREVLLFSRSNGQRSFQSHNHSSSCRNFNVLTFPSHGIGQPNETAYSGPYSTPLGSAGNRSDTGSGSSSSPNLGRIPLTGGFPFNRAFFPFYLFFLGRIQVGLRGYNRFRNTIGENEPFVGEVHFRTPLDSACRFHFSYSALDSGSSGDDFFARNQNRFSHLGGKAISLTVSSGTQGCFQSHLNPSPIRN